MDYPALKRAVAEQALAFCPKTILIEDKASGTQLIQELVHDGVHGHKSLRAHDGQDYAST
jgi:phage terminase large subunit-like protein